MVPNLDDLAPREVLLAVAANREERLRAQAEQLELAVHWCHLHGDIHLDPESRVIPGSEVLIDLGGDGTPEVEEFAAAEFGAMAHMHPMAARNLMADALDLRYRLPRLAVATIRDLRVESWLARKIATMTRKLDRRGAAYVDQAIAPFLESLPAGRLLALVEAKIIEADAELAEESRRLAEETRFLRSARDADGLSTLIARASTGDVVVFEAMAQRIAEILASQGDQDTVAVRRSKAIGILAHPAAALKLLLDAGAEELDPDGSLANALGAVDPEVLRPQVKLFLHLNQDALEGNADRVARMEGQGPMLADQLRDWLGHTHLTVTPVLDLAEQRPVDGYEFPARIVESLHQLTPADAFPWSVNTGRRRDTDHPDPYVRGGPPGQTGLHNGARLTRHHHRIKTHSDWHLVQPGPGVYLWRSPHGFWFRVDHTGTHRTGDNGVIELVSRAA